MKKENIKKAIQKFYEIRDIPYHIPLDDKERNFDCEGKNRGFSRELKKLGYQTRERVGLIRWTEQNFPKEIFEVPYENESSHTFTEVLLPGEKNG